MTRVPATGLAVGEISARSVRGGRLTFDPGQHRLMRMDLEDVENPEAAIRKALNEVTAIEIVDDQLGVYHEAVPYESILVAGSETLAENLRVMLPRYFDALAFRRLEFHIRSTPARPGVISILFGSLIDTRPQSETGSLLWLDDNTESPVLPSVGASPESGVLRWRNGQGHAVIATRPSPAADGLPHIALPETCPGGALVIEPGRSGPRLHLAPLHVPTEKARPCALLGPGQEGKVTADASEGVYDATLPGLPGVVRLIPDSARSRPVQLRDHKEHMLEILGLFLPRPDDNGEIEGVAVNFAEDRTLCTNGLRLSQWQVCVIGRSERRLRSATGHVAAITRNGAVPTLGLHLGPASRIDREDPVGQETGPELALVTNGGSGLGFLRLSVARGRAAPGGFERLGSELRLSRNRWIGWSTDMPEANHIYLDWLDTAVRLVGAHPEKGTRNLGLASYLAERQSHGARPEVIAHDGRDLLLIRNETSSPLRPGLPFRFGPLWVRLLLPVENM